MKKISEIYKEHEFGVEAPEGHLLENLNEDSDDQVELGFSVHLRN